jgi:hypothetical protein
MTGPFSDTELSRAFESRGFISRSAVMLPILRQAYKAGVVSDVTVLLEGETGTGKQVLAQAIHETGRKTKDISVCYSALRDDQRRSGGEQALWPSARIRSRAQRAIAKDCFAQPKAACCFWTT